MTIEFLTIDYAKIPLMQQLLLLYAKARGAATDSGPPGQHIHSGPPAGGRWDGLGWVGLLVSPSLQITFR